MEYHCAVVIGWVSIGPGTGSTDRIEVYHLEQRHSCIIRTFSGFEDPMGLALTCTSIEDLQQKR